jgi:magnesium transporter
MPRKSTRRFRRSARKRRSAPGAPPGTLVHEAGAARARLRVVSYDNGAAEEREVDDVGQLAGIVAAHAVSWIDVKGTGDVETITRLGAQFKLHRLVLEDINHLDQRPKGEIYGRHIFAVARALAADSPATTEQLGIYLCEKAVLTFHEGEVPALELLRRRIREGLGHIRHGGPDYLLYGVLDAVLDEYFPLVEEYGERLDKLEDELLSPKPAGEVAALHSLRRELLALRRILWPQREAIATLLGEGGSAIGPETRLYLQDCYDHAQRLLDLVDTYRQEASDLMDLHMALAGRRLTEIMRLLTLIATVFMPLTFIAGVYGMNFDPEASRWNMPELRWAYGYPVVLGGMAVVGVGMWIYFRLKGWLR